MKFTEILNPMYILTGSLLLIYMWTIGSALKSCIKNYRHGAITLGFLATMFLFGITFVWFRFANAEYKTFFIIFLLLTFGISLYRLITKRIVPNKTRALMITSMLAASFMFTIILSAWPHHLHIDSDFWLYGKFLENGSNFLGKDVPGNVYQLTNFHDFLGSFIGLFNGPITDFENTSYPIQLISYVSQIPMMMLLVAILSETVMTFNKGKIFTIIGFIVIQTLFPFRTGMIGSFMLFLPFALLVIDIMENKFDETMSLVYFMPFIFFVSSISFLTPFLLVLIIILKGGIKKQHAIALIACSALFIADRGENGIRVDIEMVVIVSAMLVVVVFQKQLLKLWTIVFKQIKTKNKLVYVLFGLCALSFIFTTKLDYEYINYLMSYVRRPIYALLSIFVFVRLSKRNISVFKYVVVGIIFVNPAINLVSNIFHVFERSQVIYHRVGNIFLFGEIFMNLGSAILIPLAVHELITLVKEWKND